MISCIYLLVVLLGILLTAKPLPAADSAATGRAAANRVLGRFNSESSFRQNAAQPLTAEGVPLYTIDRRQSDAVRITAPSSTDFLGILVQPVATGDLATIRISEDLDFNGSPDFAYTVPFPVSGVCANGIIACTPGTWDDCRPYQWTADDAAQVSLEAVSLDNLGGCYCINRSCGSDLVWSNLPVILKDLGGGIAGVIQEKKANFVITEVKTDGPTISYYGRDTSTGNDIRGNVVSASANQTAWFTDPTAMAGAAENEVAGQAIVPDSYYAMLGTSMANRGTATELHSCSVNRTVSVEQQSRTCSDGSTPDPITARCDQWGGSGTSSTQLFLAINLNVHVSADKLRLSINYIGSGGWINLRGNGSSQVMGHYIQVSDERIRYVISGYGAGAWVDLTGSGRSQALYWGIEVSDGRLRFYNTAGRFGQWIRFLTESDAVCTYEAVTVVNDLCFAMANDSSCTMQEEIIDSVQTFRNFQPTGLVPIPSTRSLFASSACNVGDPPLGMHITRDWWRKDRTYRCTNNSRFDFTDTAQRVDMITASVEGNAEGQDHFNYIDTRKDQNTGVWATDEHTINRVTPDDIPACELACKTRKIVQDTQAVPAGVTTDTRITSRSFDYLYRICGVDNTCPVGPGETVVKDCRCLEEFAEAAAVMQVLNEAGKDMICSDGVKK